MMAKAKAIDLVNIGECFAGFVSDDEWWGGSRATHLQDVANGFEKWLATEWLLWLRARGPLPPGGVGIEYKARLAKTADSEAREQKQVDLWWSTAAGGDGAPWNFVELKVVFNNHNKGKLFASAGSDLWCLAHLDRGYEKPNAAAVIAVGVGFSPAEWTAGLSRVVEEAGEVEAETRDGTIGKKLRWRAWTVSPTTKRKRG